MIVKAKLKIFIIITGIFLFFGTFGSMKLYSYEGSTSFKAAMKLMDNMQYNRAIALFTIAYKKFEQEREQFRKHLQELNSKKGQEYRNLSLLMAITAENVGDCYKKLKDRKRAKRNYEVGINQIQVYINLAKVDPKKDAEIYDSTYRHLVRVKEKLIFTDVKIPPPPSGFSIGVMGGANYSSISGGNAEARSLSGGVGATFEYFYWWGLPLTEDLDIRWGIEVNALYLDSGFDATYVVNVQDAAGNTVQQEFDTTVNTDYLIANLAIKPKFMMNYIRPYFIIGFSYNWVLSSSYQYQYYEDEDPNKLTEKKVDNREFMKDYISFKPGIGFETDPRLWPLFFDGVLFLDIIYEVSLTESLTSVTNADAAMTFASGKSNNITAFLGIKFPL